MAVTRFLKSLAAAAVSLAALAGAAQAAGKPEQITLDYAYYNPLSLVLKEKGWIEDSLKQDGISVRWVLSQGSNKAIEFLNARGVDFGSTAGAAALLARINGAPIHGIYVYSKPEWTALVTAKDSPIGSVADLRGKRIAVTRGTDPHIFLVRALAEAGLTEKDANLVLLQHADGANALVAGQVDAWAGLDPMMARTELQNGARLFYRDPDKNTYGLLNVREDFAAEHPELVAAVLASYERARAWARENPEGLRDILARAARLEPEVAARQLERTDLTQSRPGPKVEAAILAAGQALQGAGVIPADVDVKAAVDALLEPRFAAGLAQR